MCSVRWSTTALLNNVMTPRIAAAIGLVVVTGGLAHTRQEAPAIGVLGAKPVMAFVATSSAERAKAFYRDKLGLRLVREEPIALVFDANGTMLRVQIVGKITPAPYTVLGWEVADIGATASALERAGVVLERIRGFGQDALGVWTAGDGTKVAWFKDPDGNTLSVTQFPPSKTLRPLKLRFDRSGDIEPGRDATAEHHHPAARGGDEDDDRAQHHRRGADRVDVA